MATAARSTRKPARRTLAGLFADDPVQAVLTVLRDAGTEAELRAEEVKSALQARGVALDDLAVWRRIQTRLVAHEQIRVGGDRYRRTYRYLPPPSSSPSPSRSSAPSQSQSQSSSAPADALTLLAGHRLPAARRAQLVDVVRAALPAGQAGSGAADERARLARLEQREKDVVRVLADLAIEVEELVTNQASARALLHTIRTRARSAMLEPVEKAGELTHFDRTRHQSVAGPVADGAPVVVVRPGYTWNGPNGTVLVARAVVQDRSAR